MSDTTTVPDSPADEPGQTPTPLLSKRATAARLGVSEKTVERYVHEYRLLAPAGEDPQTGAKLFASADVEQLRLAPPGRRKSSPDSLRQSDLALRDLIVAMQQAHAETVRAKDETIAALRDQVDSLRQSHQALLAAGATDTDTPAVASSAPPGEPSISAPVATPEPFTPQPRPWWRRLFGGE